MQAWVVFYFLFLSSFDLRFYIERTALSIFSRMSYLHPYPCMRSVRVYVRLTSVIVLCSVRLDTQLDTAHGGHRAVQFF